MACEPRDCEVETMLGRLPNGIVVLAAEITVTTWIYFGKMSIIIFYRPFRSPLPILIRQSILQQYLCSLIQRELLAIGECHR